MSQRVLASFAISLFAVGSFACLPPGAASRVPPRSPAEYKLPSFVAPPTWLVLLDEGLDASGSFASGLSDDGTVVCGEVLNSSATGRHGRGTYWSLSTTTPPAWTRHEIPFLPFPSKDNPALGISANGAVVAGANTLDGSPSPNMPNADTYGYAAINGALTFYYMRPLPNSGQVSVQARSASDSGARIVGYGCTETAVYSKPCTAMLWGPGSAGPWTPRSIDTLPDRPPSSRAYDTNATGDAIVGEGASPAALGAYAEPGIAQEAVLWRIIPGAQQPQRTWLGVPSGAVRHHSVALGISSDSSATNGFVIVGVSGGNSQAGEQDGLDARPTRWTVNSGIVMADVLPLLGASWFVPTAMTNGSAAAVSKGGGTIVGSCARKVSEEEWDSEAVIWGWDPARPRSIREILLQSGVTEVAGLRLAAATGVSADGLTVCGYGLFEDFRPFAWVVRLPPFFEPGLVKLPPIPRRLPNDFWNPLIR